MGYSITEVLEFALAIEETGYEFYVSQAEKTTNPQVKELFVRLGKDEMAHKAQFKKILKEIASRAPAGIEDQQEEYYQYIKMLVKDMGFKEKRFKSEVADTNSILDVVSYAMNREKDTIQYYTELKNLVAEEDIPTVDRLVSEEKEHFITLFSMYESLEKELA